MDAIRKKTYKALRKSERFFKTDMIYLAKGGAWLSAGQFVSSVSAFLLAIAFANLLPKETYGTYKYVLSMASILAIPTLAGINTALTQAVARGYEGSFIPALKTKLLWGIWGGIGCILLAAYYYLNGNITLTFAFLIASFFIPVVDTLGIYGSLLNGKKLFKEATKFHITSRIATALILAAAIFFTDNLFIILLSYFLPWTLFRALFLAIVIRKNLASDKEDPQVISYGKHLSVIGVLGNIATRLDNILLFHYLGAAQVAIYTFAFAPVDQIKALYKMIPLLSLPKFANRSIESINTLLAERLIKLLFVGSAVAAVYIISAPYLFKLLFPQYLDSVYFSQLLAIILALRPPVSLVSSAVQSKLNLIPKRWLYWRNTSHAIFIAALLTLTPALGILGAIISRIIFILAQFGVNIIHWTLLTKKDRSRRTLKRL